MTESRREPVPRMQHVADLPWGTSGEMPVHRLKVHGGWLVGLLCREGVALTFVPDQDHAWSGTRE